MRATLTSTCLLSLLLSSGCTEPPPEPPPRPPLTLENGPEAPAERVVLLAEQHAAHAEPAEDMGPYAGTLARGQIQDHPLVLIGTRCYVAIASGSEGVTDLDLSLIDQNGVPVAQDGEASRDAVIGARTPICPVQPEQYRLRVRMFRGEGDYAVSLFYASNL